MRQIASYEKAVRSAIGIGRTLGDAFAWVFYSHQYDLLDEHLKQQRELILPPGIGGKGERALSKLLPSIDGMFAIYHGTTSMLRLGDVSLYDFEKKRVVAIGEIKSERIDDQHLQSHIICIWSGDENPFKSAGSAKGESSVAPLHKARLQRQLPRMAAAMKSADERRVDRRLHIRMADHYSKLESLLARSNSRVMTYDKIGNSLVVGVLRLSNKTLSSRLMPKNERAIQEALGNAPEAALSIMLPESGDNALFISGLGFDREHFPKMMPGTIPFLWWPVDFRSLREILFGSQIAVTLYNPAHLWSQLRKIGYEFDVTGRSEAGTLTRWRDGRREAVGGLNHYERLAQHFLLPDETIVEMIEQTQALARSLSQKNLQINMLLRMHTHRPEAEE